MLWLQQDGELDEDVTFAVLAWQRIMGSVAVRLGFVMMLALGSVAALQALGPVVTEETREATSVEQVAGCCLRYLGLFVSGLTGCMADAVQEA